MHAMSQQHRGPAVSVVPDRAGHRRRHRALRRCQVAEIARAIPAEDLVIQHDVAVEIGALTTNMPAAGRLGEKAFVVDSLRDAVARTPEGPERGVHLCYGDYKHRHFTVPTDR